MRYYNDMKLEEIAAAMEISRSSVKRYIASGQEHLKESMKDNRMMFFIKKTDMNWT